MGIKAVVKFFCDAPGCNASCSGTAGVYFGPFAGWGELVVDSENDVEWKRAEYYSDKMLCPLHVKEFEACCALSAALLQGLTPPTDRR